MCYSFSFLAQVPRHGHGRPDKNRPQLRYIWLQRLRACVWLRYHTRVTDVSATNHDNEILSTVNNNSCIASGPIVVNEQGGGAKFFNTEDEIVH